MFSVFFGGRPPCATSRGPRPRTPAPTRRSSTRCSTAASTCRRAPTRPGSSPPPTTTGRVQHVLDALPAAAEAAAAHLTTPLGAPRSEDDRPPAAPRRGAQPEGILYGRRRGYHLSERGRAMAERVADRIGDRDITHVVVLAARACPGDRRPAGGGARPERDARRPGDRVEQHLRGPAPSTCRTRSCGSRRSGRHLWNPFRPSWGEPYKEVVARMWPAVLDARDGRRGSRGRDRLAPAADLDHPAERRGPLLHARPAQASVHPVQPDLVHLRGRPPRQRRLLRAGRRPDPGRRPARAVLLRRRGRRADSKA